MDLPSLNDASKYLGRQLLGGEQEELNRQFGYDNARSDYEFSSGPNVYKVINNGNGTRSVVHTGTVADKAAKEAEYRRQQAIQPAIASLNATKPEITAKYDTERSRLEGEKQPLTERYQSLLDQIKGEQTTATNRQTRTTNNELAKRGISSDSGVFQQEMTDALNPITLQYTGITKDTTLAREDALRAISNAITGLTPMETADQRALTQAIADLQAATGNQSVNDYLSLFAGQRQESENALNRALQQRQIDEQAKQNDIANKLAQAQFDWQKTNTGNSGNQYATLSEGQTLYNLLTGSPMYTAPKTYKSTAASLGGGGW